MKFKHYSLDSTSPIKDRYGVTSTSHQFQEVFEDQKSMCHRPQLRALESQSFDSENFTFFTATKLGERALII